MDRCADTSRRNRRDNVHAVVVVLRLFGSSAFAIYHIPSPSPLKTRVCGRAELHLMGGALILTRATFSRRRPAADDSVQTTPSLRRLLLTEGVCETPEAATEQVTRTGGGHLPLSISLPFLAVGALPMVAPGNPRFFGRPAASPKQV